MKKLSIYNHMFSLDGKNYLYNLLTTAIAEIDGSTYEALSESRFDGLDGEVIDALCEQGFIVGENDDETARYRYFFDSLRFGRGSKNLHLMFVPTYNCNLSCPYCYEGLNKVNKKISTDGVNRILKFIENTVERGKSDIPVKKIVVSLYGGEPLMCKRELELFCQGVYEIAVREKTDLSFDMTTNLTMLDEKTVELIRKFNISVQVSVDGVKPEHDKRRIMKNGGGTYDIIMKNLKLLCEYGLKKNVTIRLNMDNSNLAQADELLNICKQYSDDVYFGFLSGFKGFNDGYKEKCLSDECVYTVTAEELHSAIDKNGLIVPQRFGKKSPCSICSQNKYIVDLYLNVYKCELLINQPECRVGTIDADGNFTPESNFFKQMSFSPFLFEECAKCKFLPVCGAGCPAKEYIESGEKDGEVLKRNCIFDEKSLDAYLRDYVRRTINR